MNAFEVLGRQVVGEFEREVLGDAASSAAGGGFNWGTLINAAAEAANQGVKYDADQKAQKKASADSAAALARAAAADAAWASAEQQLDLAQQSGDPGRIGPASALQSQAIQAAMAAGATLSADAQAVRAAAVRKAATAAAQAAVSSPKDTAKAALSRAWQKVAAGASFGGAGSDGAISRVPSSYGDYGHESWFVKRHAGLPTYVWIGGGVTIGTGLILLLKSLLSSKRGK